MNSDILLVYPIINVIVTGLFAGVVLRQYLRRHRTYQFFWAIALLMAFFASLAYVAMILVHPTSEPGVLFFRIYYILGGSCSWRGHLFRLAGETPPGFGHIVWGEYSDPGRYTHHCSCRHHSPPGSEKHFLAGYGSRLDSLLYWRPAYQPGTSSCNPG